MTEPNNVFAARGSLRIVEIPVPDRDGVVAKLAIRRVKPEVRARWGRAEKAHQLAEKKRLAELRREYGKDVMPELYERPELDVDGKPIAHMLEEPHLGADGRPVMVKVDVEVNGTTVEVEVQATKPRKGKDGKPIFVPQLLPPLQTDEGFAEMVELGATMITDAVAGVGGVLFGSEASESVTDAAGIVEMIEELGISREAARAVLRVQTPSARQVF